MFNAQVIQTDNGYKLTVTNNYGVTVYESGEKKTESQARQLSLDFMYRGPIACGGGSGDGSGNVRKRRPVPNVVKDDKRMRRSRPTRKNA